MFFPPMSAAHAAALIGISAVTLALFVMTVREAIREIRRAITGR